MEGCHCLSRQLGKAEIGFDFRKVLKVTRWRGLLGSYEGVTASLPLCHPFTQKKSDDYFEQILKRILFAVFHIFGMFRGSVPVCSGFYDVYGLATRGTEFRFLHFSAIFWQIFVRFFGRLLVDFKEKGKMRSNS